MKRLIKIISTLNSFQLEFQVNEFIEDLKKEEMFEYEIVNISYTTKTEYEISNNSHKEIVGNFQAIIEFVAR